MEAIKQLRYVFHDRNRKPLLKMIKEATHCAMIEKEIPFFYFTNLLYKKDANDYRNYIGHKKGFKIINSYFYPEGREYDLENKDKFNKILETHNIDTPKTFFVNDLMTIKYKNEQFELCSQEHLKRLLDKLIKEAKSKSVFIKPVDGEGGVHAFKFHSKNLDDIEYLNRLFDLMKNTRFIFQESIVQNKDIIKFIKRVLIH